MKVWPYALPKKRFANRSAYVGKECPSDENLLDMIQTAQESVPDEEAGHHR